MVKNTSLLLVTHTPSRTKRRTFRRTEHEWRIRHVRYDIYFISYIYHLVQLDRLVSSQTLCSHNVWTDISVHHVEGNRLEKTVWSLLNFNAYVKYHVKVSCLFLFSKTCLLWQSFSLLFDIIFGELPTQTTRGFIQRRMRKRLEGLVEVSSSVSKYQWYLEEDDVSH